MNEKEIELDKCKQILADLEINSEDNLRKSSVETQD